MSGTVNFNPQNRSEKRGQGRGKHKGGENTAEAVALLSSFGVKLITAVPGENTAECWSP